MVQVGKTFRIFVSSTFEDMKIERNALQKKVFPKIRELCMQNGCRFQAIDLRWGVREEASLNQQTIKICLEEIDRCQVTTPKPNFIVLLGNRYGWRPLPYEIPAEEYEEILLHLSADQEIQQQQRALLQEWYRRDDNAIPPVYCLQPRKKKFKKSKNWIPVENKLRLIIKSAINEMDLEEEELIKYNASATELEVINGALKVKDDISHAVCLFREIKPPLDHTMKRFVALDAQGELDRNDEESLNKLKGKLRAKFPDRLFNYEVEWTGETITTNHIDALCKDTYDTLSSVILEEITQMREKDELEKEKEDHEKFAIERRKNFLGRSEILQQISDYIRSNNNQPFVVFGKSGSGKSSLMSFAIQSIQNEFLNSEVIYRFIGATPDSSNGRDLLESLCIQISRIQGMDETAIPSEYKDLVIYFQRKLLNYAGDKILIIFLDALDQLSEINDARNLRWIPTNLTYHVRFIVSTILDDCYEMLKLKIPSKNFKEILPLTRQEGEIILNSWLDGVNRRLQPIQRKEILDKFSLNGLPLYLKLAFEEGCTWRSYTSLKEIALNPTILGIIHDLFARLSLESNHGKILVSHSMGYLRAARNGLTEDELIDLLSRDKKVYKDFIKRAHHEPPENRIPIVIWSRLFFDLEPYLTERSADGTTLLNFFHRQLIEAVKREYLGKKVKNRRHNALARYFTAQDLHIERGDKTFINLRKVSELPYHLKYYFRFKNKTEELKMVRSGTDCLVEVSTNIKEDFSLHADEIKPIGIWLYRLKEYDYLIKLIDVTLDRLENQGNWPTLQHLMNSILRTKKINSLARRKVKYQFALSRALYHMASYSDAIKIGEEALILAEKVEDKIIQADINWYLGSVWRFEGDRDRAIQYTRRAEEINSELNNKVNRAKCMFSRAIIEHGMGNIAEAKEIYDSILEMMKIEEIREGMGERICDLLRIRGDLGFQENDIKFARESWELAKEYAEEMYGDLPLKRAVARLALLDIAEGRIKIEQMKHAWKEELDELLLRQERASALTCYGEVAEICIREGYLNEAIEYCKQAEPIFDEIENLHTKSGIAYVRGIRAIAEEDIDEAKDYLRKSEKLFGKWTSPYRYWVANTLDRLKNYIN